MQCEERVSQKPKLLYVSFCGSIRMIETNGDSICLLDILVSKAYNPKMIERQDFNFVHAESLLPCIYIACDFRAWELLFSA